MTPTQQITEIWAATSERLCNIIGAVLKKKKAHGSGCPYTACPYTAIFPQTEMSSKPLLQLKARPWFRWKSMLWMVGFYKQYKNKSAHPRCWIKYTGTSWSRITAADCSYGWHFTKTGELISVQCFARQTGSLVQRLPCKSSSLLKSALSLQIT